MRWRMLCGFPLVLLAAASPTPSSPATRPADAVCHEIEDMFLLNDRRFECSDFSYDTTTKTISAKNIQVFPDNGRARVAARNGKPPFPLLTVESAKVTIAGGRNPDRYPSPVTVVLEHPVRPLSRAEVAATQPVPNLTLFAWSKALDSVGSAEWSEFFHSADHATDPVSSEYPDLRELSVKGFMYEFKTAEGKKATLVLSVHVLRDAPTHWTGELQGATRTPDDPNSPLDGPHHFEMKTEGGALYVRSTDPPATQAATESSATAPVK